LIGKAVSPLKDSEWKTLFGKDIRQVQLKTKRIGKAYLSALSYFMHYLGNEVNSFLSALSLVIFTDKQQHPAREI